MVRGDEVWVEGRCAWRRGIVAQYVERREVCFEEGCLEGETVEF